MNRDEFIFKKVKQHLNYIKDNYPQYNVIYIGLQGSQNYGLDIYEDYYVSDVDTKAIVVPSLMEISLNKQPVSHTVILPDSSHCDVKDIRLMFECFKKQNINFIEILFTKYRIIPNSAFKELILELINHKEEIAHLNYNQALRCISGMSMEKKKALTHPYPTIKDKIEKYGYDGKQLHHIIRMNDFIINYANNKSYEYCLKTFSDKDLLMKAKLNKFTLEQALKLANTYDNNTKFYMEQKLYEKDTLNKNTLQLLQYLQYRIIKRGIELESQPKITYEDKHQNYKNTFVTSDLHFGHKNILEFENRLQKMGLPISQHSLEYHDEQLIKNWNSVVDKNDLVYILGDFSFSNYKRTEEILKQLNGDKILIEGNHDMIYLENKKFNRKLFKEIISYKEIKYNKVGVVLCHYPIKYFKHQDKQENRYVHLCGHIHSKPLKLERGTYNVGVDVNNYKPILLEKAIGGALENLEGIYNTERGNNNEYSSSIEI